MRFVGVLMSLLMIVMLAAPMVSAQVNGSSTSINVEIIVDSSGSMATATDTGVTRIDSAKTVLNEVIAQIPEVDGVNVGLRVYGHRGNNQADGRDESCVSSDLLVPMEGVDRDALVEQVDELQPVGWTPLGYALEQAQDDFTEPASDEVANAIILVTDGLETCDADPAEVAGDLKDSEAGITTHVIGFGTTDEEQEILEGITEASGGQLLGSANAGQLMSALFAILEDLEVVEETGTGASRESPLGIGRVGELGEYEISVLLAAPDEGQDYGNGRVAFVARVAVTYRGGASGTPALDLTFNTVGDGGNSYTRLNNSCTLQPGAYGADSVSELFEGGSGEFNLCWVIDQADADSLVMFVEQTFAQGNRLWLDLSGTSANAVESGQSSTDPVFVDLDMVDLEYAPSTLTIPADTDVTINLVNRGVLPHSFTLDDPPTSSGPLGPGESSTVTVNLPPGIYEFYCSVPGHVQAGMVGTIVAE